MSRSQIGKGCRQIWLVSKHKTLTFIRKENYENFRWAGRVSNRIPNTSQTLYHLSFRTWTWLLQHDFISCVTADLLSSQLSFPCAVLSISETAKDKSGVTYEFSVTYVVHDEQSDHTSRHVRITKKHHIEKRICNFKRRFGPRIIVDSKQGTTVFQLMSTFSSETSGI
jgi:hypothetical protein